MKKIFAVISIFVFSIILRFWNLNEMGRTWDETYYVERAYVFIDLIKHGDIQNELWYKNESSGFPPVSRYLYGLAGLLDIERFDNNGKPIFLYDYTHARMVAVLLSSLTVILVALIGWRFSAFVGIVSGIVLAMLPIFLGFSQLATLESLILFFFTATIFSFLCFLENSSKKNVLLTGIILGIALGVKYTNILLFPLLLLIFLIWHFQKKNNKATSLHYYVKSLVLIFVIGLVSFFILWPMPWFHLSEVIAFNANLRISPYSVPEVFLGRLMLVPKIYYVLYFFITTPALILLLFFFGLNAILKKNILYFMQKFLLPNGLLSQKYQKKNYKAWIGYAIVMWFMFPFIQSFYNYKQHGIRYIIEIYAPLSLIVGIGLEYVLMKLKNKLWVKIGAVVVLCAYLFFVLFRISPYYLDYFNILVGGTEAVYKKKLFQIGWWGQGIREAAYYVEKNSSQDSTIAIALSPSHVMPPINRKVVQYVPGNSYDYIIANYYNIIREGFDDNQIKIDYNAVYFVEADGAKLVTVYKHK